MYTPQTRGGYCICILICISPTPFLPELRGKMSHVFLMCQLNVTKGSLFGIEVTASGEPHGGKIR